MKKDDLGVRKSDGNLEDLMTRNDDSPRPNFCWAKKATSTG